MQKIDKQKFSILIVAAAPETIKAFLLDYLEELVKYYDVSLVCSGQQSNFSFVLPKDVKFYPIDIQRNISLVSDLTSLFKLIKLMGRLDVDMVHSVTPKAGLLAQTAALAMGVKVRVHTFTGQVWVTKKGFFRFLLKNLDRWIGYCASHVLADSDSQSTFLVDEKILHAPKIKVLGDGSISGVDIERFKFNSDVRVSVRGDLGYSPNEVIALFVGRLNKDKGILDLVKAFCLIREKLPQLRLLLVGPDEGKLKGLINEISGNDKRITMLGPKNNPEDYMSAADFFCLPSYREGFGSVVIEAASCSLPAIVSSIYGLTDAVEDKVSGSFHPPGDINTLSSLMEEFTVNVDYRLDLGRRASERARSLFSSKVILEKQLSYVNSLLGSFDA